MRNYASVLIAVLALATYGMEAHADSMRVTYNLTGTTILAGVGPVAPPGPLGSITVNYSATGGTPSGTAGSVVHGAAQLVSGSFNQAFNFTIFGALVTGFVNGPVAGWAGSLTSGFGDLNLAIAGSLNGLIHCTGAVCSPILGLPPSLTAPANLVLNGFLGAPSFQPLNPGSLPTVINFAQANFGTFGGNAILSTITATEVSRHYSAGNVVPEPGTVSLLGMGLVLLGAAGRRNSLLRRR